ncbi:MAG: hypothetical protein II555_00215 [Bacteroidales bacterium]|nr:hypothetical protein [Bacteroidales bacterium]
MKKTLSLLTLFCLILLGLASCNNEKSELKKLIAQLNTECPIPLGSIGQMDKADYKSDKVTFYYTIVGLDNLNNFKNNQEAFHQFMLDNYRNNSDESFRQLLEAIVEADAGLDVVFSIENGESFTLQFTCEELKANMPEANGDPESYLQSAVASARLQLPITYGYGDGMVCTNIDLDSMYYTYYIDCDEDQLDLNEMQQSIDENHEAMVEMLTSSTDPSFVKMMETLKATNRGLRYFYTGTTSGKEAVVTIAPEELK